MNNRAQIKREARIIGIDTCNNRRVIGAVYRGGLYLDGIMSGSLNDDLVEIVNRSRYHPELQYAMFHDPKHRIGIKADQTSWAGLPFVECSRIKELARHRGFRKVSAGEKTIYVRTQMTLDRVSALIRLSWTSGEFPEPLRVAHLIAKSISGTEFSR